MGVGCRVWVWEYVAKADETPRNIAKKSSAPAPYSENTENAPVSLRFLPPPRRQPAAERELFICNLLVRIHLIIEMILLDRPCAMIFFSGSLTYTLLFR